MVALPLPVRKFDSAAISRAVSAAIKDANVPPDAQIVFVAHADADLKDGSASIAVMIRGGKNWKFRGYLEETYRGKLSGGAEVIFSN